MANEITGRDYSYKIVEKIGSDRGFAIGGLVVAFLEEWRVVARDLKNKIKAHRL